MALEFLHWEWRLETNLACKFFWLTYFTWLFGRNLKITPLAIVWVFFGDCRQPIAGQMETGVAVITINDLVGLAVVWAEADFAVGLEKFFWVCAFDCFGRFEVIVFLIFEVSLPHSPSFIFEALLEASQYCAPQKFVLISSDFIIVMILSLHFQLVSFLFN